uniref:Disease resistance R13L4/SHOC-2-like LRR domain-containing protein n=1 Tax=Astatotilapia calliptera TaxID=8154 RepID=A0A3P8PFR8_ASTCA
PCSAIKLLNLSRNKIIEFSQEICNLKNLQTLYMNHNNVRSIPEGIFPHLRYLKFLKLSTNRLARLPSDINQCTSLTYLDLSKNCLQNIEPLVGLPKLRELLVEKNQLTELPSQLFQKGSCELTKFKAMCNPLRCPPEEVLLSDTSYLYHTKSTCYPHCQFGQVRQLLFLFFMVILLNYMTNSQII